MKATEDSIFTACDQYIVTKHRHPTADELVKEVGGGKKEVLALLNKWKALRYLQEHGLNVPVRWISLLSDFFKSINEDVDAERTKAKEEAAIPIENLSIELAQEKEKNSAINSRLLEEQSALEKLQVLVKHKNNTIDALKQQIEELNDQKIQLNAEISEKSLHVRLQIEQINDLKKEIGKVTDRYETRIAEQKEELKTLSNLCQKNDVLYAELKDQLSDTQAAAKDKYNHLSLEHRGLQETVQVLQGENNKLEASRIEQEKILIKTGRIAEKVPHLERKIENLEKQIIEQKNASAKSVDDKMQELSNQIKMLNEGLAKKNEVKKTDEKNKST